MPKEVYNDNLQQAEKREVVHIKDFISSLQSDRLWAPPSETGTPGRQGTVVNESWRIDFVSDGLFNGRRFRLLTIVDNYSRECLAIKVGQLYPLRRCDRSIEPYQNGLPRSIYVNNAPEFISKELDNWAYENKVTLDFSRSVKPVDNAFIESFNYS